MKLAKKILSFMMALALVMTSMIVPSTEVKAASGDKTLTIEGTHTYAAYQIFAGTLNDNVLTGITWGDGVADSAALVAALKAADSSLTHVDFSTITDADSVAKALAAAKDSITKDEMDKLADIFAANKSSTTSGDVATGTDCVISNLADGYYLVVDTTSSVSADARSRYIVDIPQTTKIANKAVVPELNKFIEDEGALRKENVAGVGEKVQYELQSTVPDMTGYNKYFYIVNDTLSAGLTFNDDVTIKIGSKDLVNVTDYSVSKDGQSFKIVIKNFKQYTMDDAIKIRYSATVNEKAVVGLTTGNDNTVNLTYSNDPNRTYGGTDEPSEEDKPYTGITPDSKTTTYTTKLELLKVDGSDDSALAGAKFTISGMSEQIAMINSKVFEENVGGAYRKLKNGTYTTDKGLDSSVYDGTKEYDLVEHVTKETKDKTIDASSYVGDGNGGTTKGKLVFNDLGVGEFTIEETVVPAGFNKVSNIVIKIEQTWKADGTLDKCTVKKNGVAIADTDFVDGVITLKVENNKGIVLPSTGGIGTTIFYIVGGILVLFAGVLLITKKRMDIEK